MKKRQKYILFVWGDIEPVVYGPYKNDDTRQRRAEAIRRKGGEEHGIYFHRLT